VRQRLALITAALSGSVVLLLLFFQPVAGAYLALVLNWAIIVASVALLVAIASLLVTHIRFIAVGRRGFIYSFVLITAFLATFLPGLFKGVEDPGYLGWISAIQKPLELSLLGLIALVMMSAAVKLFRVRGWSVLTVSFAISALLFLFLNLGLSDWSGNQIFSTLIDAFLRLPVIGARGLLIGVALGALLVGFRVLIGQESDNE